MKKMQSLWGLVVALIVLLPGCVHVPTYHKQSFNVIDRQYDYRSMQNDITVQVKYLTRSDLFDLFDEHGAHLHSMTDVAYVSIHNISNQDYSVTIGHHRPTLQKPVARLMQTSSAAKVPQGVVVGLGTAAVAGLGVGVPLIALTTSLKALNAASLVVVIGLPVVFLIGALPFFGLAIKSVMMNKRIEKDLQEKILQDGKVIFSGQHYEGLVFMKKADYKPHFDIVMHAQDKVKDCVMFNVKVPSL